MDKEKILTRQHADNLVQNLRGKFPEKASQIRLVPVGHAMELLEQSAKVGQLPGIKTMWDLYNDGVHINQLGSFIVGTTFYAAALGKNPRGLPSEFYFSAKPGEELKLPSPETVAAIQQAVWDVVTTHPLTGVTSPEETPRIATPAIDPAVAGEPYEQRLFAGGGAPPLVWSIVGEPKPAGLVLDGATGMLSGTPPAVGEPAFTVRLTDARNRTAEKKFTLRVDEDSEPAITTTELPPARRGEFYRFQLGSSGGNGGVRWRPKDSRGGLPPGVKLHESGLLAGTPGLEGEHTIRVVLSDNDPIEPDTAEAAFTLATGPLSPNALLLRRCVEPVTLDGTPDEPAWGGAWHKIEKTVSGKPGATAEFSAFWDGADPGNPGIHVAVRVRDTTPRRDSENPEDDDSVAIYLDWLNNREGVYNFDDRRFVIDREGRLQNVGSTEGAAFKAAPCAGGYTVEAHIPFRNLKDFTIGQFGSVGFDVAVNDDSDGGPSDGALTWRGSATNATDPGGFGVVLLGGFEPVVVPAEGVLAAWDWGSGRIPHLKANRHVAALAAPELRLSGAEGMGVSDSIYYNENGISFRGFKKEKDPARHISWVLAPRDGKSVSVSRVAMNLFGGSKEQGPLRYEVACSADGFQTATTLDFQPAEPVIAGIWPGNGLPRAADCAGVPVLQKFTKPVEFRLFFWGPGGDSLGFGKGGGRDGLGADLAIEGTVAPAGN